jgi:hypothetical protein
MHCIRPPTQRHCRDQRIRDSERDVRHQELAPLAFPLELALTPDQAGLARHLFLCYAACLGTLADTLLQGREYNIRVLSVFPRRTAPPRIEALQEKAG